MQVYVVTYFYPTGGYAGIIGVYDSKSKAETAIANARRDYSDCNFTMPMASVE